MSTKQERVEHANQLIQAIAKYGRRFFYDKRHDRVAHIELRRGRVYFVDDYTGKAIYTHETIWTNRWRGFSHGGTLRSLIERMRDYIMAGEQIPIGFIAPSYYDDTKGNIWGYDSLEAYKLRTEAMGMPIIDGVSRV